jgi:hypothetical protein
MIFWGKSPISPTTPSPRPPEVRSPVLAESEAPGAAAAAGAAKNKKKLGL